MIGVSNIIMSCHLLLFPHVILLPDQMSKALELKDNTNYSEDGEIYPLARILEFRKKI